MTVNWHDSDRPKADNKRNHTDFKWGMFKQWFRGYYFLWKSFWRAEDKDFNKYVVKVKCKVKWVYATPWFSEFCLRINDWNRIWSYGMICNSKDIFKSELECKAMYEDYFNKHYQNHIIEDYNMQIKRKKDSIQKSKVDIKKLAKRLSDFKKHIK